MNQSKSVCFNFLAFFLFHKIKKIIHIPLIIKQTEQTNNCPFAKIYLYNEEQSKNL